MEVQKGESLIELLIAIGIFVVAVSTIAFLVIDSYLSGRLAKETTQANFLAEEGIEAARSIRDNSWDSLLAGSHGLALSGNNWVFQGVQEDVSWQLREGIRTIIIEDIDSDRKKVTSEVVWKLIEARPQQAKLIAYLTNWQKITSFCQGVCTPCSTFLDTRSCKKQDGCDWIGRDKVCVGTCIPCENFLDQRSCEGQSGCFWTAP